MSMPWYYEIRQGTMKYCAICKKTVKQSDDMHVKNLKHTKDEAYWIKHFDEIPAEEVELSDFVKYFKFNNPEAAFRRLIRALKGVDEPKQDEDPILEETPPPTRWGAVKAPRFVTPSPSPPPVPEVEEVEMEAPQQSPCEGSLQNAVENPVPEGEEEAANHPEVVEETHNLPVESEIPSLPNASASLEPADKNEPAGEVPPPPPVASLDISKILSETPKEELEVAWFAAKKTADWGEFQSCLICNKQLEPAHLTSQRHLKRIPKLLALAEMANGTISLEELRNYQYATLTDEQLQMMVARFVYQKPHLEKPETTPEPPTAIMPETSQQSPPPPPPPKKIKKTKRQTHEEALSNQQKQPWQHEVNQQSWGVRRAQEIQEEPVNQTTEISTDVSDEIPDWEPPFVVHTSKHSTIYGAAPGWASLPEKISVSDSSDSRRTEATQQAPQSPVAQNISRSAGFTKHDLDKALNKVKEKVIEKETVAKESPKVAPNRPWLDRLVLNKSWELPAPKNEPRPPQAKNMPSLPSWDNSSDSNGSTRSRREHAGLDSPPPLPNDSAWEIDDLKIRQKSKRPLSIRAPQPNSQKRIKLNLPKPVNYALNPESFPGFTYSPPISDVEAKNTLGFKLMRSPEGKQGPDWLSPKGVLGESSDLLKLEFSFSEGEVSVSPKEVPRIPNLVPNQYSEDREMLDVSVETDPEEIKMEDTSLDSEEYPEDFPEDHTENCPVYAAEDDSPEDSPEIIYDYGPEDGHEQPEQEPKLNVRLPQDSPLDEDDDAWDLRNIKVDQHDFSADFLGTRLTQLKESPEKDWHFESESESAGSDGSDDSADDGEDDPPLPRSWTSLAQVLQSPPETPVEHDFERAVRGEFARQGDWPLDCSFGEYSLTFPVNELPDFKEIQPETNDYESAKFEEDFHDWCSHRTRALNPIYDEAVAPFSWDLSPAEEEDELLIDTECVFDQGRTQHIRAQPARVPPAPALGYDTDFKHLFVGFLNTSRMSREDDPINPEFNWHQLTRSSADCNEQPAVPYLYDYQPRWDPEDHIHQWLPHYAAILEPSTCFYMASGEHAEGLFNEIASTSHFLPIKFDLMLDGSYRTKNFDMTFRLTTIGLHQLVLDVETSRKRVHSSQRNWSLVIVMAERNGHIQQLVHAGFADLVNARQMSLPCQNLDPQKILDIHIFWATPDGPLKDQANRISISIPPRTLDALSSMTTLDVTRLVYAFQSAEYQDFIQIDLLHQLSGKDLWKLLSPSLKNAQVLAQIGMCVPDAYQFIDTLRRIGMENRHVIGNRLETRG